MIATGKKLLEPGSRRAGYWVFIIGALALAACDRPDPETPAVVGVADTYSMADGMALQRPAPGVLANDPLATAGYTAKLATQALFGKVTLEPDGAFSYEPAWRFTGHDGFTYQLTNGTTTSAPIPVRIGPPNVVVILVDDLGQGDIGAYTDGSIQDTPNLDAIAEAGIAFTHVHSPAAVCAPSRYSVLTGNYPYRGRLAKGIWDSYDPATMIIPGQTTLGNIFREAGYTTGFVGKMHNGGAFWNQAGTGYTRDHADVDFTRKFDRGPTQFGFDYSFLLPGGVSGPPYAYFENDRLVRFDADTKQYAPFTSNAEAAKHFVYVSSQWGEILNGGAIGAPGWVMDNYDARMAGSALTRQALNFIDRALTANEAAWPPQPFFLYFAPPQIHPPYSPPGFFAVTHTDDTAPAAAGIPVAGTGATPRVDMIRETDLLIGAIIELLEEKQQLANTLIIVSSDNGPITWPAVEGRYPPGKDGDTPLRGLKGEIYEGGHRVPLLARWGDGSTAGSFIMPGTISSQLFGLNDLAATFIDLLGRQRASGQVNDSRSFLPVLLATAPVTTPLRDHLIVQGEHMIIPDAPPSPRRTNLLNRGFYEYDSDGALWKLIVSADSTDPTSAISWRELYNLSKDPGETVNLLASPEHQAVVQSMQANYRQLIAQPQTITSFK